MANKGFHGIQTVVDALWVTERGTHPLFQQSPPCREMSVCVFEEIVSECRTKSSGAMVQSLEEGTILLPLVIKDIKVAKGDVIQHLPRPHQINSSPQSPFTPNSPFSDGQTPTLSLHPPSHPPAHSAAWECKPRPPATPTHYETLQREDVPINQTSRQTVYTCPEGTES